MPESKRVEQNSTFAKRLLVLLDEHDQSQADLARALRVDRATVTRYIKGRVPPVPMLQAIADHFGVTTDYLLGRVTNPHAKASETSSGGGGMLTRLPSGDTNTVSTEADTADDELIVVFRGKRRKLSPEYQRLLIKMMEAEAEKMAEEEKQDKK